MCSNEFAEAGFKSCFYPPKWDQYLRVSFFKRIQIRFNPSQSPAPSKAISQTHQAASTASTCFSILHVMTNSSPQVSEWIMSGGSITLVYSAAFWECESVTTRIDRRRMWDKPSNVNRSPSCHPFQCISNKGTIFPEIVLQLVLERVWLEVPSASQPLISAGQLQCQDGGSGSLLRTDSFRQQAPPHDASLSLLKGASISLLDASISTSCSSASSSDSWMAICNWLFSHWLRASCAAASTVSKRFAFELLSFYLSIFLSFYLAIFHADPPTVRSEALDHSRQDTTADAESFSQKAIPKFE